MTPDVKKYFAAVPEERKPLVDKLHTLIVGLYPQATVEMAYKMPTYKFKDGWVAIANQKRYVSLYTCSAAHLAKFKEKHPEIKTGTGCINFKPSDKVPLAAVKQVVRHAIEHAKGE